MDNYYRTHFCDCLNLISYLHIIKDEFDLSPHLWFFFLVRISFWLMPSHILLKLHLWIFYGVVYEQCCCCSYLVIFSAGFKFWHSVLIGVVLLSMLMQHVLYEMRSSFDRYLFSKVILWFDSHACKLSLCCTIVCYSGWFIPICIIRITLHALHLTCEIVLCFCPKHTK